MHTWRHSWIFAVLVVFFSRVVDGTALSFLLPLLPRIIRQYYCQDSTLDNIAKAVTSLSANFNGSSTTLVNNGTRSLDDVTGLVKTCDDVTISIRVGLAAGIGPALEVIMNPLIAYLVIVWGESIVFNLGGAIQIMGISFLAFVREEWGLFLGRICQAVGSAMSVIAGYTLLVAVIKDDSERVRALSLVYSGLTVGYLTGYLLGGFLYELCGAHIIFLFLLVPSVIDISLRLAIPWRSNSIQESNSWKNIIKLLTDPYMILTNILIFISYGAPLLILATLPNYLVDRTSQWQISILYFIATAIETALQLIASKFVQTHEGRFRVILLAFSCHTIGLVCVIVDWNVWAYVVPIAMIRVGEGLMGAMVTSLLAYISDVRLLSPYSAVYAVYCTTFTAALALSPIGGGYLVPYIGVKALYLSMSGITFLALLLSLALRKVPIKDESLEELSELIPRK